MNVVVANTGDLATSALTTTLGGADAQQFTITVNACTRPLNPFGTCSLQVALKATSAGIKTALLAVSSPVGGLAQVALMGYADQPDQLEISPTSADFASTSTGATSQAASFQVRNTGGTATAPLTASVNSAEFVITANTCGGTSLAAGGTCNVSVAFKPASPGQKSAVLAVSGGGGHVALAPLFGIGL